MHSLPTGQIDYSIIVPAWNEAAFIEHSLNALFAAMRGVDHWRGELVVVDNNSSDDTASVAEGCGARVVFEAVNQISRARNTGARAANGRYLIFIDADSHCDAVLLRETLDSLASGSIVGGGSPIRPDRPVNGLADHGLRFWNFLSRSLKLAAGCFVFCRRDAFEAVGGFSERVYAGEEIYLSRALKRHARRHGGRFAILETSPVTTSIRKLDWYSPLALFRQTLLVLIPGALYSKRLCRTWYDEQRERR